MKNSIKLNVRPTRQEMEIIGQRTDSFMKWHGISDETVHAQIRIIRELVKTAAEYGNFSPANTELRINVQVDKNTITVEINNLLSEADFERLAELDKTIQFIRGYQDPFEAFRITQKEASINSPHGHSTALNLSRIAYEEKVNLDFFVNEDKILQLSAISRLEDNSCNSM